MNKKFVGYYYCIFVLKVMRLPTLIFLALLTFPVTTHAAWSDMWDWVAPSKGVENTAPTLETTDQTEQPTSSNTDQIILLDPYSILLSEVFPNAKGSDEGKEWIELYNNTNTAISLENMKIQRSTGASMTLNGNIEPFSYLQIPLNGLSLHNTEDTVTILNGEQELDSLSYASTTEEKSWSSFCEPLPLCDVELSTPTPGAENTRAPIEITLSHDPSETTTPFTLHLESTPDTKIFYTLNADPQSPEEALLYSSPLPITSDTILWYFGMRGSKMSPIQKTQFFIPDTVSSLQIEEISSRWVELSENTLETLYLTSEPHKTCSQSSFCITLQSDTKVFTYNEASLPSQVYLISETGEYYDHVSISPQPHPEVRSFARKPELSEYLPTLYFNNSTPISNTPFSWTALPTPGSKNIFYSPVTNDSDHDGLTDAKELSYYNTDPYSYDTDGDGLPDNFEIKYGLTAYQAESESTIAEMLPVYKKELSQFIGYEGSQYYGLSQFTLSNGFTDFIIPLNGEIISVPQLDQYIYQDPTGNQSLPLSFHKQTRPEISSIIENSPIVSTETEQILQKNSENDHIYIASLHHFPTLDTAVTRPEIQKNLNSNNTALLIAILVLSLTYPILFLPELKKVLQRTS